MPKHRVKKSDELFELKDITVEEVGMVDHAANMKKFLVVKSVEPAAPVADSVPAPEVVEPAAAVEEVVTKEDDKPEETPAAPAPEAPETDVVKEEVQATVPKIHPSSKKALTGALVAMQDRLNTLLKDLASATEDDGSTYLPWELGDQLHYLVAMSSSITDLSYGMSGVEWEVEAAAVAELSKSIKEAGEARVEKIGRAISGARMRKMRDIHESIAKCTDAFKALIEEVDQDKPSPDVEKAASEKEILVQDLEKAKQSLVAKEAEAAEALKKLEQEKADLQKKIQEQEDLINAPANSNRVVHEKDNKEPENVWSNDMNDWRPGRAK